MVWHVAGPYSALRQNTVHLLALVCDVYCVYVPFPCGILGQVWYFIASIPDLCQLSYVDDSTVFDEMRWTIILQEKQK